MNVIESEKGDYVSRLEARIRELATRLHKLETEKIQYKKTLSTGKVIEGRKSPPQEVVGEISLLKTKIDKLSNENRRLKSLIEKNNPGSQVPSESEERLLKRIAVLENEKANIEESLRAEVLDNEEKRNYVEILKEALEAKIEDLGLKDLLLKSVEEEGNINEVFTKLVEMRKEIEEKHNDINRHERNMQDMERTIATLKRQAEDMNAELSNAHNRNMKLLSENEESTKRVQELIQKVRLVWSV